MDETSQSSDESSAGLAPFASEPERLKTVPGLPKMTITALAVWLVMYATIGARLYVSRGPGEAVPLASVVTVLLVALVLVSSRAARTLLMGRFKETPWLLALVSVWTVLSLAGPIVGYPLHTVFTATTPLSLAALCAIGLLLAGQDGGNTKSLYPLLVVVAWIQFVVGVLQALWYTGVLTLGLQRWLYLWDVRASVAFGVEQIVGRSVGLYLNPNPYSLLGALLFVFALTLDLRLRDRMVLGLPAFGIVLLGASRSAAIALVLVTIPWAVYTIRSMQRSRALQAAGAVGAVTMLLIGISRLTQGVLFSRFASRWTSMPDLLAVGAVADANAAGRLEAWSRILPYWARHPFGTFGPPQMAVSSFTDNDYITLLLQGGIILLVAYLGTLASSLARRRESTLASSIAPLVGVVAFTGLTQTSIILAPTLALFWPAIGTTMGTALGAPTVPDTLGPRRVAAAERLKAARQRRAAFLITGSLVLVVVAALGIRVAGRGFEFPLDVTPAYTRPTVSADATATLPGWRVNVGDSLGMYYVDLPPSDQPDRVEDLSMPQISPAEEERLSGEWEPATAQIRGQSQVIPVAVAIAGVRDYTRYVATGDQRFASFSQEAADWLLNEQRPDGSWRYRYATFDLAPGWVSANMQSVAVSLLARVYQDSEDERYLIAAERAYEFMLKPVADGGVLGAFGDGQAVLQGYANSSVAEDVMSGALVGPLGVYDLAFVTGDAEILAQFTALSRSMASHLDAYEIGGWSRYSLGIARGPSPHLYHRLYVVELRALGELSGDARFGQRADHWSTSLDRWLADLEASDQ